MKKTRLYGQLVAVLAASVTLWGCGASLMGHRIGFGQRPQPKVEAAPDEYREAREHAALDSTEPFWPYRLGQLYVAADSLAPAEAALKTALARDACYTPALSLLSKLYFERGRHEEAVKLLEAARAHPDRFPDGFPPALLAGLALHYDALGQTDPARAAIAGVTRSRRDGAGSALVYLTLRGESPDSAAALASKLVGEDGKSAVNQNNYGITRLRAGDPEAARRAFLKAIDLEPSLAGPYYNLAILEKFYVFDDKAAAKWLEAYRSRSKDDPDSLFGVFDRPKELRAAETNK